MALNALFYLKLILIVTKKNLQVKSIVLLVVLFIFSYQLKGQAFISSAPFTAGTPFLEPDNRRELIKISDNEFVVLSKIKGGMTGSSEYSLEKYDADLKNYFKSPITIAENEEIRDIFFNGTDIVVFVVVHNTSASESKLIAYGFNSSSGAKKWDKVLMQNKITPFQTVRGRGAVEESFENAILSCLSKSYVTPIEYQYDIQYSPDESKIIVYAFDYAKPNLIANAAVFDKNIVEQSRGVVPIDNNFVNYGIFVNNLGMVYILNVDKLGRIVVIQYNLINKDNKLLDIQYSSTQRESLRFSFVNDDEVFVGCTNTNQGKLAGVMYCKFSFKQNLVEKINFHELGDALIETANAARGSNKNLKGEENWMNFELTHFSVNKYEKVLMVLEKREVNGYEYAYKSEAPLDPANWKERIAKVNTEGLLMFSFNSSDELMWENYYSKSQMTDVAVGMSSSSFILDADDELIRIVYGSSDNAAGTFNLYNYVQWDATNGNKVKELPLQNDDKLSLVRNYSVVFRDKVVLVGRKGLLAKKYLMSTYQINHGN